MWAAPASQSALIILIRVIGLDLPNISTHKLASSIWLSIQKVTPVMIFYRVKHWPNWAYFLNTLPCDQNMMK